MNIKWFNYVTKVYVTYCSKDTYWSCNYFYIWSILGWKYCVYAEQIFLYFFIVAFEEEQFHFSIRSNYQYEIDERLFAAIKSSILHAHVAHDTTILFYSRLLCFINEYPFQSGSRFEWNRSIVNRNRTIKASNSNGRDDNICL